MKNETLSFHDLEIGYRPKSLMSAKNVVLEFGLHVLVAPNGYGKSSLFRTLAGVTQPLAGEVRVAGRAFVPESDAFYMPEYLTMPRWVYPQEWISAVGFLPEWHQNEAAPLIKSLRMNSVWAQYVGRLSQGERRKLAWMAADLSKRKVLLLDEPANGLDLLAMREVRQLIKKWELERRIVFLVSHQTGDFLDLAKDIWLVDRDREMVRYSRRPSSVDAFRAEMVEYYTRGDNL